MRKLLFFDIDGTLVDGKKQAVPESAVEGLWKAHQNGHLLFVNTGRCKSFMPSCLEELPWDGFIYGCGSHVEYRGKVLMEAYVSREKLAHIREAMEETGIQGIFQGPEYCYFSQEPVYYHNFQSFLTMYDRDYKAARKSFYEDEMKVNKVVTFREDSCDYGTFKEKMRNCQMIENGGGFMELLPLPFTKATGMDVVCGYFGIRKDDCYVFGDSPNDLPMLMVTKNSIAMGNSCDLVKERSSYVTDNIEYNGIYKALIYFQLI